jgi:tetratricopeptide (TPR) repeat protein
VTEGLLRKDPLNLQYIQLAKDAALAAQMPEVAMLSLEIAKEHYPDDIKVLETLAKLYTDNNRLHDARLVFEDIIRLKPNDPKAIKQLKDSTALDTMQRGNWMDQESDFRTKLKNKGESATLERESKAVKTDRDVDNLIAETRGKVQREPGNINYKRALADLYIRAERFEDAMTILEEAQRQIGGQDPQIERMISQLRIRRLDHEITILDAAGQAATAAVKRKEKDIFLLADAEDRVRRYPNDLQFKYDFGILLYEHQRYTEAAQQFQLAVRNPQRRLRALFYLGLCFKHKQQYDLARDQLEKAVAEINLMDENKKEILYELGSIAEAVGDMPKAIEHYKEIYAVDISYRDITAKIESFYGKAG